MGQDAQARSILSPQPPSVRSGGSHRQTRPGQGSCPVRSERQWAVRGTCRAWDPAGWCRCPRVAVSSDGRWCWLPKPAPPSVPSHRQSDQTCRPRSTRAMACRLQVSKSFIGRLAGTAATFRLATAARLGIYFDRQAPPTTRQACRGSFARTGPAMRYPQQSPLGRPHVGPQSRRRVRRDRRRDRRDRHRDRRDLRCDCRDRHRAAVISVVSSVIGDVTRRVPRPAPCLP